MPRKKTIEDFITRARIVHGDKYDYSLSVYKGTHTKLEIICPKHGSFWQDPDNHLHRHGCPTCMRDTNAERFLLPLADFIKKANQVHSNRYDYSKVEYKGTDRKVCIVCPDHGDFWQVPHNHLHGAGCPKCTGNHVPSTPEFIERAKSVYGEKYDYSKADYVSNKKYITITCPEHGDFQTYPQNFLRGHGCPWCSGNYGIDLDYFVSKSNERFDNKYDYSQVEWKGYQKKVRIICPEHGAFWQTPNMHLRTLGCPKCSGRYLDQEFFIEKASIVHNNKYDYSKVQFVDGKTPVCVICPSHGEFWIKPSGHLLGHGCSRCAGENASKRLTKSVEDFVSIAQNVHHEKYDYSQVQYVNRATPVRIICPKHGAFMQKPKSHIRGNGCPMCNTSVLEECVTRLLISQNIPFIPQKQFEWLSNTGLLFLDFFLPDYSLAIECQGIQHFSAVEYFGGEKGLLENQKRDEIKKCLCEQHGIKLLYFSNLGIKYPYPVIEGEDKLLNAIHIRGNIDTSEQWRMPELPLFFEE